MLKNKLGAFRPANWSAAAMPGGCTANLIAVLAGPPPRLSFAVLQKSVVALHLYTRIYFDGEAANAADPVMALVRCFRGNHLQRTNQRRLTRRLVEDARGVFLQRVLDAPLDVQDHDVVRPPGIARQRAFGF